MQINGATALVTGANRGLGKALVAALQAAGAARVYAAARDVDSLAGIDPADPVPLDITDVAQVAAAAARCRDVTLLINNAGIARFTPLLAHGDSDNARAEMETNYFGTLAMCRAFAPVLKANGGGMLVNVLSVVSWFNAPMQGSYCASKSAEWSLTNAIRHELRGQGTAVAGVFAGYIDTDMTAGLSLEKTSAEDIAQRTLAGIAAGDQEILADARAQSMRAQLLGDYTGVNTAMQAAWDNLQRTKG